MWGTSGGPALVFPVETSLTIGNLVIGNPDGLFNYPITKLPDYPIPCAVALSPMRSREIVPR